MDVVGGFPNLIHIQVNWQARDCKSHPECLVGTLYLEETHLTVQGGYGDGVAGRRLHKKR